MLTGTTRSECPAARSRGVRPIRARGKTRVSVFALVRAVQGNSLRSRERRFESCRGHSSET